MVAYCGAPTPRTGRFRIGQLGLPTVLRNRQTALSHAGRVNTPSSLRPAWEPCWVRSSVALGGPGRSHRPSEHSHPASMHRGCVLAHTGTPSGCVTAPRSFGPSARHGGRSPLLVGSGPEVPPHQCHSTHATAASPLPPQTLSQGCAGCLRASTRSWGHGCRVISSVTLAGPGAEVRFAKLGSARPPEPTWPMASREVPFGQAMPLRGILLAMLPHCSPRGLL